ncbi:IclR family transcriptional regulator [Effusibacillus dendaii]|uniref:Glycerol operon regulatory protein n=1 Tax=Effusibacillus dendaii TaxID=2743772 RepID=A0A7I8D5P9_9BACL|nr:helix-turn-helix domain-containing protein [Effusibacillus dendaii]BCJ85454.1 glycerol operon regulatory protein [Effusibacillus dendaii]
MYTVPAVITASRILKLLARSKYRQSTLTEIADHLAINKSTCLRVLRTLQQEELVRYNERTRMYMLGSYLIVLGNRAADFLDDVAIARVHLSNLAHETGHTAILAQKSGADKWICIAKEEPPVDFRITITIGQQFPIDGTSLGACLRMLDETVNFEQSQVLEKGYAVSMDGFRKGISSVAAPIIYKDQEVRYVLSLLAVTSSVSASGLQKLAERVKAEALRISEQISRLV